MYFWWVVIFRMVWKLQFDGASRGNPGRSAGGYAIVVIKRGLSEKVASGGRVFSQLATNNVAEYTGLIDGLKKAHSLRIKLDVIEGDSKLIVNQVNGVWKTKDPKLVRLRDMARVLLGKEGPRLSWIRREKNLLADDECNVALNAVN